MSNDLIEKRNDRTKQRKAKKKKIDSIIGLSIDTESKKKMSLSASVATISDTNQVARLLDEGYCDNGFVLMKGTIEKFLNGENEYVTGWEMEDGSWKRTDVLNLTDDFVGTVNLGHQDFATHPFILGEFKKSDFTIEDIGDDRKALNVDVRLDEESMYVKELRRQPYDIGVSAEFWYHIDWDATQQLEAEYGMYIPAIDEIFIFAYGLVGECGNVNSSGLELKGDFMKKKGKKELIKEETLDEKKEELGVEEIDITEVEEEPVAEEEPAEEAAETEEAETEAEAEAEEEAEEDEPEEEAEGEEDTVEEVEEDDEDDDDEAEDDSEEELSIAEIKEHVQSLKQEIAELKVANAKLKKSNRKLSSKYQTELDKKEKFKETLKGLSVELLPGEDKKPTEEKKNAVDREYVRSGIGEI